MQLYDKHLTSIEALKREKARLKVKKSFSKASDLMPVKDLKGKAGNGFIGTAYKALNATGQSGMVMAIAGPLLKMIFNRSRKRRVAYPQPAAGLAKPHKPSRIKKLAVEVIGGYIKWKAVEMGFNAIKMVMRSRKRKKEQKRRTVH